MTLRKHSDTQQTLDKLAERLFGVLEELRASARGMAEHQASLEKRISSLEAAEA
jgi:hypothetical protein